MSSAAQKRKQHAKMVDAFKSKKWYEVYAPKSFKEGYIGLVPSGTPESLLGRRIETLLSDFTSKSQHDHVKVYFKVIDVPGGEKGVTKYDGHELKRDFIKGVVMKSTSLINGIFNFTTQDGFTYRASTVVVTKRRAKQSQQKTIRRIIYEVLTEFAKNNPHEKFIRGILYGLYAENIKKIAKSIYPIRRCEIFKSKVIATPEQWEDQVYEEDKDRFEEIKIGMHEHGKTVKSKKQQKRRKDAKDG